ncbi:MAG TPA: hypothetical protein VFU81_13990 [Thermomicrobiales bacterium]|nr:hypothetical protein [Thermomicrobiales bacterium]
MSGRMKPLLLLAPAAMTAVFAVVGERRDDPLELLVLGADGQHYACPLPDGPMTPAEPNEEWRRDQTRPVMEDLIAEHRWGEPSAMAPHDLDWVDVPLRPRSLSLPAPSTARAPAVVSVPLGRPNPPLVPTKAIALALALLLGASVVDRWRRRRG